MPQGGRFQTFKEWFVAGGGYFHCDAEPVCSARGVFLRVKPESAPLDSGSMIVSCPHKLIFSFANIPSSSILSCTILPRWPNSIDRTVLTRLFLIEQYLLDKESFWWPYIQSLPQPDDEHAFNTPLWYEEEDFVWLHGTNLGKAALARKDVWEREFKEAMRCLNESGKQRSWTWQLYLWSTTVLTSRSFPSPAFFEEGLGSPALIPGLDLLNHTPSAKVTWDWNSDSCVIKTNERLFGGIEIYNNYGPKNNEELLLGYGFCISDNTAKTFGLGFSYAVSKHVQGVKRARYGGDDNSDALYAKNIKLNDPSQISEQHWVRLKLATALGTKVTIQPICHELSPHFLEHFSITLENRRERHQHDTGKMLYGWGSFQTQITFPTASDLSRNRIHVLNALIMLLEKSRAEIRQHDHLLQGKKPTNSRQQDASIYRDGQLKILNGTLAELHQTLALTFAESPANGVLQLDHILTLGPDRLVKDLRSLLHVALGTRNPSKIRERGGVECAFTLWLCGLWTLHKTTGVNDETELGSRLSSWLEFLDQIYSDLPPRIDKIGTFQSANQQCNGSTLDVAADSTVAGSYMTAIDTTVQKHPKSLYNDKATITVPVLLWCLNIVREEGVRCANSNAQAEEEEDEYIIFLERGIQQR